VQEKIVNRLKRGGNRPPCRATARTGRTAGRTAVTRFSISAIAISMAICLAKGGVTVAEEAAKLPEAMHAKAARLVAAYPEHLERLDGRDVVWKDGTRMAFDDGRGAKSFEVLLAEPDLEDMFAFDYPKGRLAAPPQRNHDPGRVRPEAFFRKMYGDCRTGGVQSRLVGIDWLGRRGGGKLRVTTVNRVHERLAAVSRDLERLPAEMTRFLVPAAGTFNCRAIAGTDRRSMHAFGAAIDISARHGDYWRWSGSGTTKARQYRNRVPMEIVEIFERHGFIWGGKWYHFDTMHFEYRPELLR
jgi:hypothetical protein